MNAPARAVRASLDRAGLRMLVDDFYGAVRRDARLGPVFDEAIGAAGWPAHLDRMVEFWSTVMLGARSYRSNLQVRHQRLRGLDHVLFERWLQLFGASAYALFEERDADELMAVALRVARGLRIGLQSGLKIGSSGAVR